MVQIKWTRKALQELASIYDYIAKDSPRYARLQVEKITKSAEILKKFPQIGRTLPEFPESEYREVLTKNYRVIYRFNEPEEIVIMTVLHMRRQLGEIEE